MTAKTTVLNSLPADLNPQRLPHHIAVIMDGNGRWAKQRGLPRIMGHQKGVDSLRKLVRCCNDWGIAALTVYAFSTENWGRPLQEVEFVMTLIERFLREELQYVMDENGQIRFIGDLGALPQSLQKEIERATADTAKNTGMRFTVATNYGGRQEILKACQEIALAVQAGQLQVENIDEAEFERHLYTAGVSHPDLLIRTSGEIRISNFLLWQIAYAEIYVTPTLWPDFDQAELHQALRNYQQRERRFGKLQGKSKEK